MPKKNFLEEKYCEINQLKTLLQTYPKEYCETIIKVMNKVFDEISDYLEEEKKKVKKSIKKHSRGQEFTIDELSKYNGRNGNKAYIAIDGIVYDMENVEAWKNGMHFGISAGKDLSSTYLTCHSNELSIIKNANAVGILVNPDEGNRWDLKYYKIEDIAQFNGIGNNPAYVSINGIVYDVTDIKQWDDGKHYGLVAGKDLSEYFNSCHKGEKEILNKLRVVGKIIE